MTEKPITWKTWWLFLGTTALWWSFFAYFTITLIDMPLWVVTVVGCLGGVETIYKNQKLSSDKMRFFVIPLGFGTAVGYSVAYTYAYSTANPFFMVMGFFLFFPIFFSGIYLFIRQYRGRNKLQK